MVTGIMPRSLIFSVKISENPKSSVVTRKLFPTKIFDSSFSASNSETETLYLFTVEGIASSG